MTQYRIVDAGDSRIVLSHRYFDSMTVAVLYALRYIDQYTDRWEVECDCI